MKTFVTGLVVFLLAGTVEAQSRIEKLGELTGKWEIVDEKVVFSEVYEFPDKSPDELIRSAESYFSDTYPDHPLLIIGDQGFVVTDLVYPPEYMGVRGKSFEVLHDMVLEFRESRVKISVVLRSYNISHHPLLNSNGGFVMTRYSTEKPEKTYPINLDSKDKRFEFDLFYTTYQNAREEMNLIRDFIREPPTDEPIGYSFPFGYDNW